MSKLFDNNTMAMFNTIAGLNETQAQATGSMGLAEWPEAVLDAGGGAKFFLERCAVIGIEVNPDATWSYHNDSQSKNKASKDVLKNTVKALGFKFIYEFVDDPKIASGDRQTPLVFPGTEHIVLPGNFDYTKVEMLEGFRINMRMNLARIKQNVGTLIGDTNFPDSSLLPNLDGIQARLDANQKAGTPGILVTLRGEVKTRETVGTDGKPRTYTERSDRIQSVLSA